MTHHRKRHTVYLSDLIWGELRKYVINYPGQDASQVVEYVITDWLKSEIRFEIPTRSRWQEDFASAGKRTVYLPPETWEQAAAQAAEGGFSVSMLIELLLRRYLAMDGGLLRGSGSAPPAAYSASAWQSSSDPHRPGRG
jgi:hypothetical protein